MEKWELQELVDEAIAMDKMVDSMINEYVYEFTHKGKKVRDLTYVEADEDATPYDEWIHNLVPF